MNSGNDYEDGYAADLLTTGSNIRKYGSSRISADGFRVICFPRGVISLPQLWKDMLWSVESRSFHHWAWRILWRLWPVCVWN